MNTTRSSTDKSSAIQELARIAYDFQGLGEANLHTKRRRWYNKAVGQKPYKEVDFVISAKLGSAEVNFECRKLGASKLLCSRGFQCPIC